MSYEKMREAVAKLVDATTAAETLLKKMRDDEQMGPLKFDGATKVWAAAAAASDWVHACQAAYERADIRRRAGLHTPKTGEADPLRLQEK